MTTALEPQPHAALPVPFLDIDKIIGDRETKIIICCGSGGVDGQYDDLAPGLCSAYCDCC